MANNVNKSGGVGLVWVLVLIFITLKLTDNIDWSWWWVFSPIWISLGILAVVVITLAGISSKR